MAWDSCLTRFQLDFLDTKNLDVGDFVTSVDVPAGGHLWRIVCYPRGVSHETRKYVSLFLELRTQLPPAAAGVPVIFDAFALDRGRRPVRVLRREDQGGVRAGEPAPEVGWSGFVKRRRVDELYVGGDGRFTLVWGVIVLGAAAADHDAIPVPPSRMGAEIAGLLGDDGTAAAGADVSFSVGGETVPAHRAVLAARSPVFRAELLGAMSDATSPSIAVRDVDPAAFRLMVRYVYADALPGDDELGGAPEETVRHLLAAADRYALDRLKLMCAQRLWEKVTADTFASTLAFAETYSCPELKSKCIGFFAVETNLKQIIFTDGFRWLMQEFPSLVAELRTRVHM